MTEDAVWKKLTEQWESECLCDRQTNRREQRQTGVPKIQKLSKIDRQTNIR